MKATINGIRLHYTERGHGVPVIFVHGFPFGLRMWEPQMLALPDYYRRIAYDIRGFGQSGAGSGQYMLETFVDDLFGLLDELGVDKAILCGLSMGGYIALRAVERAQDRFFGLVLCDTKSSADDNKGKLQRAAMIREVQEHGSALFAQNFVKKVFAPGTLSDNQPLVQMMQDVISVNSTTGIVGALLAMAARTDTTEALSSVKIPTMILVGEHDELAPLSAARDMQQRLTNVELHVVPDAAHMSNLENPTFFNDRLISFLHGIRQEILDEAAG